MSRDIKKDDRLPVTASHTRIYDVFSQERLPDCDLLLAIVQVLAERLHRRDDSLSLPGEQERFYQLWLAADGADQPESGAAVSLPPVFPVYLVVEESAAVSAATISNLNAGILRLCSEIASTPAVADKLRFCLIGFSSSAHVLLPLSDLSEIGALPGLAPGGQPCYRDVFDLLRTTIDQDGTAMLARGNMFLRPWVFFITASPPADPEDWPAGHHAVTDSAWRYCPTITAFGFRGADSDTVKRIATAKAVLSDEIDPALVLEKVAKSLVQSVVKSAATPAPGGGLRLIMSDEIPGETYTVVNADPV